MAEVEKKTAEVVAVPATAATAISGEKQGAKCCGCCCDYRRAVIVMAIIGISFAALSLILTLAGVGAGAAAMNALDDDEVIAAVAEGTAGMGILVGATVVAVLFYVFQLFAALKYNVCMLYTVVVFELISLALNIYQATVAQTTAGGVTIAIIINCLICALIIYPTAGLIKEIKEGIMSVETYPREAYSCCCMNKV
eukprot:CAMPEP_0116082800 /NCGR_PEP_ID=MMETSP0327-20121206/2920_1 /TAXON_ID=44447 /ORGANISM="Pseudo-nitzschia delicatissima, Strain B596" /LENGTH=195 /DNA_ID=CAMNT_0003573619 /DNA_START=82 /DNA_END=669 /DNA_ORIENTATION=-